jgi:diguanylate cyclase (GGDEF)-like protein
MPPEAESFSQVFERLRAQYEQLLPGKLDALEAAFAALQATPGDHELLRDFHRQAHSLTGSGASYGFAELSRTARTLELALKRALDSSAPMPPAALEEIRRHLDVVRHSAVTKGAADPMSPVSPGAPSAGERLVAILEPSASDAEALATQVSHFGYRCQTFGSPEAMLDYAAGHTLKALILPAANPAGIAALAPITALAAKRGLPVLFTSDQSDLPTRLAGVRAGGIAYFTKPVDAAALVDQLDRLDPDNVGEPYRVLIIDDQPIDAALYASALDSVGMITYIANDPLATLNALREFNPELVLLDMYMPGVSGAELAQVIRQQSAYVSIPLVFLSAETDVDRQHEAMRNGADDFLTKPINLQHLVASVTTRAQRYRELRSFMQRDSLTGLLNHTKSKEYLDTEVARAEREHWPLSFAMVDIDHFKKVNDTFGHPVGDRVIKSIARLLQQRLRRSDLVGRYGGEEFAVIMSNTTGETAARVMDEIREAFSRIQHQANNAEFSATFSCGVAELRPGMSTNELASKADKALYQAKHRGRNQVVLA